MNQGAYILLLRLPAKVRLEIGRLGEFEFAKGYYAYVGSALNNLEKRIARYRLIDKPRHWHIDYFRPHARWVDAWRFESRDRIECRLNSRLMNSPEGRPVPRFGSSDCGCKSHFHYFSKDPSRFIRSLSPGDSELL